MTVCRAHDYEHLFQGDSAHPPDRRALGSILALLAVFAAICLVMSLILELHHDRQILRVVRDVCHCAAMCLR